MSVRTRKVRAAVVDGVSRLAVEELDLGAPRRGEVLVRMAASGVCHSDLHQVDGDYGPLEAPAVMGHEGAGYVEEIGDGVRSLEPGQLVTLNWYYPCLRCVHCQQGRQMRCTGTTSYRTDLMPDGTTRFHRADGTDVLASGALGTFATRTVVVEQAAVLMPAGVPVEVAALIGCAVTTGANAVLNTAAVPAGASVAVIGLGGVGLSAVMGAVVANAHPIVGIDRDPAKLERAAEFGVTRTVLSTDDSDATIEAIRDATDGGPEFAVNAVGHETTSTLAIGCLSPGGTAIMVGLPRAGARASFDIGSVVLGEQSIKGSLYGSSVPVVDFPRLAHLYLQGRMPIHKLVERTIELDDVRGALDRMRRGEGLRSVVLFDA